LGRSAEEAASFVRTIQAILRHVGTSNANMDKVPPPNFYPGSPSPLAVWNWSGWVSSA